MTTLMPNTFQHPNVYIDQLDHLLTPAESKVLTKATREILGFWDNISSRSARISLSVFVDGKFKRGKPRTVENRLCWGCGLSKPAVITALNELDKYKILVKVGDATNDGQMYTLEIDQDKIDWDGLRNRQAGKYDNNLKRTEKARNTGGQSDLPPEENALGGKSDLPPGGKSDLPKETHRETQIEEEEGNGVNNFTNSLDDPKEFSSMRVTDFNAPVYLDDDERSTFGNITKRQWRNNQLFVDIAANLNGLHGFSLFEFEEFYHHIIQPARDIPRFFDWATWVSKNNGKGKGWRVFKGFVYEGMNRDGDGNYITTFDCDFERWLRGEFVAKANLGASKYTPKDQAAPPPAKVRFNLER